MQPTRLKIYRFICEFHAKHRTPPSYREIVRAVGVSLTTVGFHIRVLIADGLLVQTPHMQPVPANRPTAHLKFGRQNGATRREAIVAFIRAWQEAYGVFPTYAEVAHGVGLASGDTVRHHLLVLEKQGKVRKLSPRRWCLVESAFTRTGTG